MGNSETISAEIRDTVQIYFDGLYRGNVEMLRLAFHPTAMITGYGSDGNLNIMSLTDFLSFVDRIPSPESEGIEFDMEILSMDTTTTVAAVKVRDLYLNRNFTDYLHLIETKERWQIIGKMFHSEPLE